LTQFLHQIEILKLFTTGCILFNKNKIDDAHAEWELIWKHGNLKQKKAIKGFIQLTCAFIQFDRKKIDSAKYLLKLSLKNIANQKYSFSKINSEKLISDLKFTISKLENNNLKELKFNIKF